MPARGIGLAWDENVALRMVSVARRAQMYSGAIWITDALARAVSRGEALSPRLRAVRRVLRQMSGVFVLSRAQVEPLSEFLGPQAPEPGFVQFGVDADFYRYSEYPERPLVASVGGDRDRDIPTLFAALERVHAARPDAKIVVQTSSDVAPPDGVTKVPYFTHLQLRELYASASLMVIATRPNLHGSGMTVSLESMATGRPVVITRTPGMADYVQEGTTGHFAPPGDAEALAEHVTALLADPDGAAVMGRAARRSVEESGSTQHLVAALASFMNLPGNG